MIAIRHSRNRARRPGGVTAWVVLSISVLIGLLAIGLDGGRLMEERRHVQMVADAAALAAATDLYNHYYPNQGLDPSHTARDAALASALANGYANDGSLSVVTVNVPPQRGAFKGVAEYAEVIIQSNVQGTFGALFTGPTLPVQARAVARGRPRKLGLHLMQSTGPNAFNDSSNGTVSVSGPIVINSGDPSAYNQSKGNVTADSYEITGGYSNTGGTMLGTIHTGVTASLDPLRNFPTPSLLDYVVQSTQLLSIGTSGATTLQPGIYQGGINVSGSGNITLLPGVYIIDGGGFSFSGKGTITGNGVMIYNTGISALAGPVQISGKAAINLAAPTSGTWQGICLFQDRSVSQTVTISGAANTTISGAVYAHSAQVSVTGNSTTTTDVLGGAYVCNSLQLQGGGSFTIDLANNRPHLPDIHLAE